MSTDCSGAGAHSFIHNLTIATPCSAYWHDMEGDDRARFCGQCKLNVYNVSELTIAEAEELIIGKEGKVCLRLYRREDGTVITKDCPVGIAKKMKALARRSCAAIAALGSVIAGYMTLQVFTVRANLPISRQLKMKYEELELPSREVAPSRALEGVNTSSSDLDTTNTSPTQAKSKRLTQKKSSVGENVPSGFMMGAPPPVTYEQFSGSQKTEGDAPHYPTAQPIQLKPGYVTEYE